MQATALQALASQAKGTIHIVQLDVTDEKSVEDAVWKTTQIVGERGIDRLVNNAGIVRLAAVIPSSS